MQQLLNSFEALSLYHYNNCQYCEKTRRAIPSSRSLVELKDIHVNPENRHELISGGGYGQVPCLRIERLGQDPLWIYESASIIDYLVTH